MAHETTFYCQECCQECTTYISSGYPTPTICHECSEITKQREKTTWLFEQQQKQMATRIAELEAWVWDYQHSGPSFPSEPPRF